MENHDAIESPSGDGESAIDPASMDRSDAAASVVALLGDLRYVVGRLPHEEWPKMAAQVLEHHSPAIDESLLDADHVGLQRATREALDALVEDDYNSAKGSIEQIRRFEARLRLELEDVRSTDPA